MIYLSDLIFRSANADLFHSQCDRSQYLTCHTNIWSLLWTLYPCRSKFSQSASFWSSSWEPALSSLRLHSSKVPLLHNWTHINSGHLVRYSSVILGQFIHKSYTHWPKFRWYCMLSPLSLEIWIGKFLILCERWCSARNFWSLPW